MVERARTKNFSHYVSTIVKEFSTVSRLILDLSYINDNHNEILNAIKQLKTIYPDLRFIILADKNKIENFNEDLLRRLVDNGVYDILTNITEEELTNSILHGKNKEDVNTLSIERADLTTKTAQATLERNHQAEERQRILEQQALEEEMMLYHKSWHETLI